MTGATENLWRRRHALALAATIVLGLASRAVVRWMPEWWVLVGDGCYAMAVYWVLSLISPRWTTLITAWVAVGICILIELSQLYHTPWLDTLRNWPLGGMLLGHGFSMEDVMAYAAGGAIAWMVDTFSLRAPRREPRL
jgi:hypothetical protein